MAQLWGGGAKEQKQEKKKKSGLLTADVVGDGGGTRTPQLGHHQRGGEVSIDSLSLLPLDEKGLVAGAKGGGTGSLARGQMG